MPSCSASESDSKYVRQIFKHGTSRLFEIIGESKPKRLSATGRQPLHIIPDIPSTLEQQDLQVFDLFSGHSRANPFGPDFERYKTLQKHRLDREADYASFPSSAATDCASSERIRTCTRSSETILLRSWIATVADCVSFSGLFFRIRSINC